MSDEKREIPLISVIVPVYKVETYLDRCISSIVKQSYQRLEIILVDDGSPDRCGEICDSWALQDTRIQVIHKTNGGLSDARNAGIDKSCGAYLCFIDSDDYIEPEMIWKLYEAITKTSVSIAICNYVYEFEESDENGSRAIPELYQIQEEKVISCQELLQLMKESKYTFGEVVWNKLYQKSMFEFIRFPVGKIHEDEFVFHRLAYQSQNMVCIPYVGYHYVQRENSIMGSQKNYHDAMEAILDRCIFFMDRDEKKMAVESEKRLLGVMKKAKKEGIIKKNDLWLKRYISVVWRFYRLNWVSWKVLCKRIVRFYVM